MRILALCCCTAPLAALIAVSAAFGYPTSVNWVPTADTVGSGTLLIEYDNYGCPKPMVSDSVTSVLTQIGVGPRLEFGFDRSEDSESASTCLNAKYRVFSSERDSESGPVSRIAAAVGAMDVWRDSKPTFYTVLSGPVGSVRLHVGWIRGSCAHGTMLGADLDIGERMWCGLDYIPGDQNHIRLGLSREIGRACYLTLTFGHPNDRSASSKQFGVTFSTYLDIGR